MTTTTGSLEEQAQVLPETAAAFQDLIRQQARLALMQVIEQVGNRRGQALEVKSIFSNIS